MKKLITLAAALAVVAGTITSCQDEDFDVSTQELKVKAFQKGFADEFGVPSGTQNWDFYAQSMELLSKKSVTRASGDTHTYNEITFTEDAYGVGVVTNDSRYDGNTSQFAGQSFYDYENLGTTTYNSQVTQPSTLDEDVINEWKSLLPEFDSDGTTMADNTSKGTTGYTLKSSGVFAVSAVSYQGWWERRTGEKFEFGIRVTEDDGTRDYPLFSCGMLLNGSTVSCWDYPYGDGGSWTDIDETWTDVAKACPNPNWSAYVYITPNTEFSFYLITQEGTYTSTDENRSMLLYSSESDTEQAMMIGFEDTKTSSGQTDINDFIVYITGELPVPVSKRFFAEDLYSLDWDYNDVVFDVSNTGVTLRAVGGTLPVFLEINGSLTGELHGLMHAGQTDAAMQNRGDSFEKDGETYYKPINVGDDKYGIKLDPVKIITWSGSNRLEDDEVVDFDDVTLYVGTEYGQTSGDVRELVQDVTLIEYDPDAEYPAVFSVPVSVSWMLELTKITEGYPTFYTGRIEQPQVDEDMWYNYNVDTNKLYNNSGDAE